MSDRARGMLDDLDADTKQVPSYDQMLPPSRVPTLTLLYHPRLARVGERVRLTELVKPPGKIAISRLSPELAPPGQPSAALPLATSFVSRRPLWLIAEYNGTFTLDATESGTHLVADGVIVTDTHTLTKQAVDRGVVLELAKQVVVLLHLTGEPAHAPERFGLVGDSDGIVAVRKAIARVARLDAPALVRGETGTGKELVAKAVHSASPRAEAPYLAVNMAAIPASLASSELFGHVRGAFSGAKQANAGYFGRADGGTLFMDEIGDTPLEVQAALLRVLETGEVQQIGADRVRKVDVRLVAATDADIEKEVEAGRFRAPLLYRLAMQEIRLPPLRERRDDIGRLLVHFLGVELEAAGRGPALHDTNAQGMSWLPAPIVARLCAYHWPGNVRQLRNVARYLASVERGERGVPVEDPQLNRLLPTDKSNVTTVETSREDLQSRLAELEAQRAAAAAVVEAVKGAGQAAAAAAAAATVTGGDAKLVKRAPSEIPDAELIATLEAKSFKLGPTAKALGISRPALNDLIDAHPTLVRANTLSEAQIEAVSEACGGDFDKMWRELRVSKRGLKLRMSALDMLG